jgi:uncharacterized membrane protein YbaN (DUF454 family)
VNLIIGLVLLAVGIWGAIVGNSIAILAFIFSSIFFLHHRIDRIEAVFKAVEVAVEKDKETEQEKKLRELRGE